jgi:hypothetical protein
MRGRIMGIFFLIVPLFLVLFFARPAVSNDMDGGDRDGGAEIPDLVVRKVTVTPVRARVGDVIRIEMEWDFWGDITENAYDTNVAAVRANGKVVASKSYTADFNGVRPGETYRETFLWDTKGMAPGSYRIRGEVPVRIEKTPYDNYLDVKKPVLLVPAGSSFPAGEEGGGVAVAESPY